MSKSTRQLFRDCIKQKFGQRFRSRVSKIHQQLQYTNSAFNGKMENSDGPVLYKKVAHW